MSSGAPFVDPVALAVVPGADLLQLTVSDPPTSVVLGGSFPVTDTVRNQGIGAADATTTRYYLSPDATKSSTDKRLTGSRAVGVLDPGASSSGGTTVTVPSSVPGATYFLIACADDLKHEPEPNETNNCLASAGTVTVRAPDLVVSALSNPPGSAHLGSSFSVTDTVTNQGDAASGTSTNRYYLSLDQVKSTSDKKLTGSRSVPGLGAGLASTGTVMVTIPSGTTLGTYSLIACADDSKVVVEAVETNNCRTSTTQVTVTP